MKARDFIRGTMSLGNGISQQEVSRRMRRNKSFISKYLASGNIPSIELAAEIADAVDCDLIVYNRETGLEDIIEPPER